MGTPITTNIENQPHALYRFWDAGGQLLYVGLTMDPASRWKTHSKEKPWWTDVRNVTLEWFPCRTAVKVAEIEAIIAEKPLYNVVYQPKPKPVRVIVTHRPLAELLDRGDWLSVTEVVELMRPHRNTVKRADIYRWVKRGKIGYRRAIGGRLVLDPADIANLVTYHRSEELASVAESPTE